MSLGFKDEVEQELAAFRARARALQPGTKKIAAFDADGTLWMGDLGETFFQWQIREGNSPHAPKGDPWGVYARELTQGDAARAFLWLGQWNAGVAEADLNRWCREFVVREWQHRYFAEMKKLVGALRDDGFEIWVVTASPRWAVQAAVVDFGIDPARVIGVSVELDGKGRLTERPTHETPYRDGKARLLKKYLSEAPLFCAGNSSGDIALLNSSADFKLAVVSDQGSDWVSQVSGAVVARLAAGGAGSH